MIFDTLNNGIKGEQQEAAYKGVGRNGRLLELPQSRLADGSGPLLVVWAVGSQ